MKYMFFFIQGGQLGNDLFDSIPCGWIIEIRRGPKEYGKIYKVLNADIEL